jgi:hypothetical protein
MCDQTRAFGDAGEHALVVQHLHLRKVNSLHATGYRYRSSESEV